MKSGTPPYRYIIIPAALGVIFLMILLWLNLSFLTEPLVKWMASHNIRPSPAWFSVAGVLIVVITGVLMFGIISFISRQEDKYLQTHRPPPDPSGIHYNEIDGILRSMELSLAKIKENSEKMKVQTERIIELNRHFFAGSAPFRLKPQNSGHPGAPSVRPLVPDKLFGGTDIYALGSSGPGCPRPLTGTGESPRDPGVLPEQEPEFIAMIKRITCLLQYIKK
ncbi:MAG: hypothetical protein LBP43_04540 [Treponema sp.]|jgi:hypothetical protein|nr:hypothetical protein [Treponema sp.]